MAPSASFLLLSVVSILSFTISLFVAGKKTSDNVKLTFYRLTREENGFPIIPENTVLRLMLIGSNLPELGPMPIPEPSSVAKMHYPLF